MSALAHGTAFARWKRWSEEEKQKEWALYGWFTGLSFCGSTAGALAYACRLRQLLPFCIYSKLSTIVGPTQAELQQMQTLRAEGRRWTAAHFALFPLELSCVVLAQLLVLRRMQQVAVKKSRYPERWRKATWGLLGVVVSLNVLGIFCNFGAAFYYNQAAGFNVDSANAFAANDTATGMALNRVSSQKSQFADGVASIQRFSEVSVLMLIVAAFLIVGFFCARVIASAMQTLFTAQERLSSIAGVVGEQGRQNVAKASVQGKQLQRKVIGTVVFVFAALLVRSVFNFMYAVALALSNNGDPCALNYCDTCKNDYSNIIGWILYTPAFQQVAILIASPIALLVALWGMSGVQALGLEKAPDARESDTDNSGLGFSSTFSKETDFSTE